MTVIDSVTDILSDTGSDVLGSSDSILSNGDSYTIEDSRVVDSTLGDSGSTITPYYIGAGGDDIATMEDTGSSTLVSSGQTFSTDTIAYSESNVDDSSDTISYASNSYASGNAHDYYLDIDFTTITNSDGVTTSVDSFTMGDNHTVSGENQSSTMNGTSSSSLVDNGTDTNDSAANGGSNANSSAVTFSDTDTSSDSAVASAYVQNQSGGSGGNEDTSISYMGGSYWSSSEGSGSSYLISTTLQSAQWNSGTIVEGGSTYPYNIYNTLGETYEYKISGPPPSTATLISISVDSTSGTTYAPFGEYQSIALGGGADTAGRGAAVKLGYAAAGPVQGGGGGSSFDIQEGIVSALGGEDVRGLEFAGAEVQPIVSNGSLAIDNYDGYWNGTGVAPAWESHPTISGYVRGNQSSADTTGPMAAVMDSGTKNGTPLDELRGLGGYGNGYGENATSAQPAPTPRSQQQADDVAMAVDPETEGASADADTRDGSDLNAAGAGNSVGPATDDDDDDGADDNTGDVGNETGNAGGNGDFAKLLAQTAGDGGGPQALALPYYPASNGSVGPLAGTLQLNNPNASINPAGLQISAKALPTPPMGAASPPASPPQPAQGLLGSIGSGLSTAGNFISQAASQFASTVGKELSLLPGTLQNLPGAAVDSLIGTVNGLGDSFIKPFGFRMNGGPMFGHDQAFEDGNSIGKWIGFGAQVAGFVAGVVGLATTLPALLAAGGAGAGLAALVGGGSVVLASGASVASAIPVVLSGAAAIGGLVMAMSSAKDLAGSGGNGNSSVGPEVGEGETGALASDNPLKSAIDRGMKILRGPGAPDAMIGVLKKLGRPMSREQIGNVIHAVKDKMNIGAAEDLIFDLSGGMWDSRTGEYIGKMWEPL